MYRQKGHVRPGLRYSLPVPHSSSLAQLWHALDSRADTAALLPCFASDAALTARLLATLSDDLPVNRLSDALRVTSPDVLEQIALYAGIDYLAAPTSKDWWDIQAHLYERHRRCARHCGWLARERGDSDFEAAEFAGLIAGLGPWMDFAASPQKYIQDLVTDGEVVEENEAVDLEQIQTAGWPLSASIRTALMHGCDDWQSLADAPNLVRLVRGAVALTDDPGSAADTARELQVDRSRLDDWLRGATETGPVADPATLRRDIALRLRGALLQNSGGSTESALLQAAMQLPGCSGLRLLSGNGNHELTPVCIDDPQLANLVVNWQRGTSSVACAVRESQPVQTLSQQSAWRYSGAAALDTQLAFAMNADGILVLPLSQGAAHAQRTVLALGMDKSGLEMLAANDSQLDSFMSVVRGLLLTADEDHDKAERRIHEAVHEARNPLTAINNVMFLLKERHAKNSEEAGLLDLVQNELGHLQQTLNRLAEPATQTDEQSVDLKELIDTLVRLWRESYKGDVADLQLTVDIPDGLPRFTLDAARLRQVLINLIKNAAEAQARGGQIVVRLRDGINFDGGLKLLVSVSDTGPGLPDSVRKSLYQAVGSSKHPGHSGLGLVIVRKLVDELQGHLICDSDATRGTSFQIYLPRQVSEGGQVDRKGAILIGGGD